MDTKLRIKQRREERIRRLMDGATFDILQEQKSGTTMDKGEVPHQKPLVFARESQKSQETQERDPEWLWKKEHGHFGPGGRSKFNLFKSLLRRTIVSGVIFAGVWGMFQLDTSWTVTSKAMIASALHRDMDFAAATAWYERNFGGTPSFLPVLGNTTDAVNNLRVRELLAKPVAGTIVQPFALSMKGIEIVPDAVDVGLVQVTSADAGQVTEILGDATSGMTVVIKHKGGVTAIYGRLNESEVQVNDWVEAGTAIGSLKITGGEQPATLYFAIKEGEKYVDPAEVVALD